MADPRRPRGVVSSMVRRLAGAPLLVAALVAFGACAAAGQTVVYGSNGPDEPLDARLYAPAGGRLQFAVSRAAYVAIFEVAPGRGVSLTYPAGVGDTQRRFISGSHSVHAPGFLPGRSLYRSIEWGGYYEPSYLVLIASERPLRVHRMLRNGSALLTEIGFATFHSMANIHAVYRLAEQIVPDPERTEWTYDTYVIWPEVRSPVVTAFRIVCADGRTRVVTAGFVPRQCLDRRGGSHPPGRDTTVIDSSDYPRLRPPRSRPRPGGAIVLERERERFDPRRHGRVSTAGGRREDGDDRLPVIVTRGERSAKEDRPRGGAGAYKGSVGVTRPEPARNPAPVPEASRPSGNSREGSRDSRPAPAERGRGKGPGAD